MKLKQELQKLRTQDAKVLRQERDKTQIALQKAKVDLAFGRATKPSAIRELRKQIARVETVLQEKEHHHG